MKIRSPTCRYTKIYKHQGGEGDDKSGEGGGAMTNQGDNDRARVRGGKGDDDRAVVHDRALR